MIFPWFPYPFLPVMWLPPWSWPGVCGGNPGIQRGSHGLDLELHGAAARGKPWGDASDFSEDLMDIQGYSCQIFTVRANRVFFWGRGVLFCVGCAHKSWRLKFSECSFALVWVYDFCLVHSSKKKRWFDHILQFFLWAIVRIFQQ